MSIYLQLGVQISIKLSKFENIDSSILNGKQDLKYDIVDPKFP